ncbi:hypothetical protein ACRALDRAFT_1095058 [Sodiomyces alcalophilus JCM 7366]|uniref:uncharacterized protein n=1 Tax=Sodiomyces alcalophilus JCM 7366 TaxID=591952 RepID=UPI0039B48E2C
MVSLTNPEHCNHLDNWNYSFITTCEYGGPHPHIPSPNTITMQLIYIDHAAAPHTAAGTHLLILMHLQGMNAPTTLEPNSDSRLRQILTSKVKLGLAHNCPVILSASSLVSGHLPGSYRSHVFVRGVVSHGSTNATTMGQRPNWLCLDIKASSAGHRIFHQQMLTLYMTPFLCCEENGGGPEPLTYPAVSWQAVNYEQQDEDKSLLLKTIPAISRDIHLMRLGKNCTDVETCVTTSPLQGNWMTGA